MLEYAAPNLRRRYQAKHVAAMLFGVVAIGLGVLFAVGSVTFYARSVAEPTTREKRLFREDAARLLACSLLLIVPGIRYTRVGGVRGDASDVYDPDTPG